MNSLRPKKKIMFLLAHLHKGGMQRAVSNISQALPEEEFTQYVGFFGTESPGFKYNASLVDFDIPGSEKIPFFGKLHNFIKRLWQVRTFVKSNNIDIVISFGESANVYNILSLSKAKKFISCRVSLEQALQGSGIYTLLYKLLVKACYPFSDKVICVSKELGLQIGRFVKDKTKLVVIPNLYHIQDINKLSRETLPEAFASLEECKFILNVGSLCYQKGQDDLIEIFKELNNKHNDLFLVIMGRGEWKDKLLSLCNNLALERKIIFIDFDTNPYRYMARASAFVLTSRFEGFPNVLVEAMACGTPVVAFDCPTGPSEILEDSKWGFLIKNRSKEDAVSCLNKLLEDNSLRAEMSIMALRRASDYSSAKIAALWSKELS
ncbi:glycosyltransferase [Cylindrospermopsis raciborskii G7]|uniref:glycosyltransferase n=1 Tax=Cylindrospermopsis raciborskii TaxID=77022 RepID=UPI003EC01959